MSEANEVLLITNDDSMTSEVLRLAAAAGVQPMVLNTPQAALPRWSGGAAVLVGSDLVGDCAAMAPPRRAGVHVLARGAASTNTFAAALALGAEGVVDLSLTPNWLLEILSNLGEAAGSPGVVVGVIGACGGAGASVFASALAQASSWERPSVLIDTDPVGPGLDRILGAEGSGGARWDALAGASGRLSGWSLRDSLPNHDGLSLLSFPTNMSVDIDGAMMRRVLEASRRGFSLVVVDLPRRLDSVVQETLARCDQLVIVTPMTFSALASGARLCQWLPDSTLPRQLLARGAGLVVPKQAADTMRVPLLATMNNLGAGPLRRRKGPLGRAAVSVAAEMIRAQ
jgi:secretion/DNA translocation related CpaE-like protein